MGLFDGSRAPGLFPRAGEARGLFGTIAMAQNIPEGGRPSFRHGPPGRPWEERAYKAIIRAEDSVGPDGEWMTSPRGATGPAQVRPATAREVARQANIPWDERRYRSDPEYNLALGRAYYRRLLDEFGDEVLAAAAYNWGPTALRGAICDSRRTGTPLKTYLPAETLKYITRVAHRLDSPMIEEPASPRRCPRN